MLVGDEWFVSCSGEWSSKKSDWPLGICGFALHGTNLTEVTLKHKQQNSLTVLFKTSLSHSTLDSVSGIFNL